LKKVKGFPSPMAESDRALLVLDMTVDRVTGPQAIPGASQIVRFIQGELRYFRERGRPVVFCCTARDLEQPPEVVPELWPRGDEQVMYKTVPSAFFDTSLGDMLRIQRVRRVTLVGTETHTSVLLTAADAVARGFEVVVPDPCVCARDLHDHQWALRQIRVVWPSWPDAPGDAVDLDETGRLRRPSAR
jgi:nicotinamidase-related amidase